MGVIVDVIFAVAIFFGALLLLDAIFHIAPPEVGSQPHCPSATPSQRNQFSRIFDYYAQKDFEEQLAAERANRKKRAG